MKRHFEIQKRLYHLKKEQEEGEQRKAMKEARKEYKEYYYDRNKSYQNPRKAGLDKTT